ncbi:MAG: DUF1217 domain-containing protein [Roseovarius sp.]|jgi:hypothetical protein|nr:DUF1217 domain-containing protein [Roseovarius sp.]
MTFAPVVPVGGLVGFALLNRTIARQTDLFNKSPVLQRDTDHFAQNIGSVQTAGELVGDRRLLRVALGAFGLQDDIDSRAFVRAILEQGTEDRGALANRLGDDRYRRFAETFGFAQEDGPRTADAGFAARIIQQFQRREFEAAVGAQDEALRLALNADRELAALAEDEGSANAFWFRVLGTPPLRRVFEVALGLPQSFAQLDIDRQLDELKTRASRQFGVSRPADLLDDEKRDALLRQFLLRDQISALTVQSSQAIALTLLRGGG